MAISFRFLLVLLLIPLSAPAQSDDQDNWALKKESEEIAVYSRNHPDLKIHEYKVEAVIHANMNEVYRQVIDFKGNKKFLTTVESVQVRERYKDSLIFVYLVFGMPWPLKNRDLVVAMHIHKKQDTIRLQSKAADGYMEPAENKVRISNYNEDWLLTKINQTSTKIELQGHADPGGSLPAWIVNMYVTQEPYNLISGVKEMLE